MKRFQNKEKWQDISKAPNYWNRLDLWKELPVQEIWSFHFELSMVERLRGKSMHNIKGKNRLPFLPPFFFFFDWCQRPLREIGTHGVKTQFFAQDSEIVQKKFTLHFWQKFIFRLQLCIWHKWIPKKNLIGKCLPQDEEGVFMRPAEFLKKKHEVFSWLKAILLKNCLSILRKQLLYFNEHLPTVCFKYFHLEASWENSSNKILLLNGTFDSILGDIGPFVLWIIEIYFLRKNYWQHLSKLSSFYSVMKKKWIIPLNFTFSIWNFKNKLNWRNF